MFAVADDSVKALADGSITTSELIVATAYTIGQIFKVSTLVAVVRCPNWLHLDSWTRSESDRSALARSLARGAGGAQRAEAPGGATPCSGSAPPCWRAATSPRPWPWCCTSNCTSWPPSAPSARSSGASSALRVRLSSNSFEIRWFECVEQRKGGTLGILFLRRQTSSWLFRRSGRSQSRSTCHPPANVAC